MTSRRHSTVKAHMITTSKASSQRTQSTVTEQGQFLIPPNDPTVCADIFEQNPYHMRCARIKAGMTVGLGLNIVPADGKPNKKPDEEYKKLQDFIDRHTAYAGQSFAETILQMQLDYEIYGWGYLEMVRSTDGELAEVYPMRGMEMRVKAIYDKDKKRILRAEAVQVIDLDTVPFIPWEGPKRKTQGLKPSEFIRLQSYNPRNRFYGSPEWMPVLLAMVLDRKALEFNVRRMDNNAIPDFIVAISGGELGKDGMKRVRGFLRKNFGGVDNAGKALVLESDGADAKITVERMSAEIKEASFRLLRDANRDEVVSCHGVPPRLVGIVSAGALGQGAEAREQLRIFREITMKPRYERIEALLNGTIVAGIGVKGWKLQFNRYEGMSGKDDSDFYGTMIDKGVLKPSVVRAELGYKPEDGPEDPNGLNTEPAAKGEHRADPITEVLGQLLKLREALEILSGPTPTEKAEQRPRSVKRRMTVKRDDRGRIQSAEIEDEPHHH